jgi:hypothetical protein
MEDCKSDLNNLFRQCQRLAQAPFSSFAAAPTVVTERMKQDGLSLPAVATKFRHWAGHRPEVRKVVLGSTSKRYTIAILAADGTDIPAVAAIQREVRQLTEIFGSLPTETYVLSQSHADANVLIRHGTYEVFHRGPAAIAA